MILKLINLRNLASVFFEKIKLEKDILNLKFESGIPAYVFYDTVLHNHKIPYLSVNSEIWIDELAKISID